jgi:hypothetical protein
MEASIKRVYQLLIILGLGVLLFVLALTTPLMYNNVDFSMYNPGWNGCSNIAVKTYEQGKLQPTYYVKQSELTIGQHSFADYSLDPDNSSILIIGPQTSFSDHEAEYIKKFLNNGGMVFLADDFGSGNNLLSKINASSRFTNDLLMDLSFEKKASFVTIFDFQNLSYPMTDNVTHILLNYPTSIKPGKNTIIIANSSEMSWLDTNLNGKEDAFETSGPFPVMVVESYGEGEIVMLSDPSVLINSMENQLDNKQFRDNLISYLYNGRSTVIIDESHREISTPFHVAYLFPTSFGVELKTCIILLIVCVFIVGFTSIPKYVWKKFKNLIILPKKQYWESSNDSLVDDLLLKHPSWSKKKLEEIIRGYEYE